MKVNKFNYILPNELIADHPTNKRDKSRLLLLNRQSDTLRHHKFDQIINLLHSGDILVLNNSKVFPARLTGKKAKSGGKAELLLTHKTSKDEWEAIAKNSSSADEITFENSRLIAKIISKQGQLVKVSFNLKDHQLFEEIEKIGRIPLPPYIEAKRRNNHTIYDNDKERYQTIYAKKTGSSAAPTAGLHFSQELLAKIRQKGIHICEITLHVGFGTFAPVETTEVESHQIHAEYYMADKKTIKDLYQFKKTGHRIIAVGTTTTRVLEQIFSNYPQYPKVIEGWTELYIYPGYHFRLIDGLITNFHLPKSSLLFLVAAFAGKEKILYAYNEAINRQYRFYSYGDAMFII
jgi:S-adenosylmethionine:tRNA ribosyltransferase-isomerase